MWDHIVSPAAVQIHWPASAKFNLIGKDLEGANFAQACERQQDRGEKSKLGLPTGRKSSNVSPTRLLDIRESTQEGAPQATKLHECCCSQNSCLLRCCRAGRAEVPTHKSHLTHQSPGPTQGLAQPSLVRAAALPGVEEALTPSCLTLQVLTVTLTQPGCWQ